MPFKAENVDETKNPAIADFITSLDRTMTTMQRIGAFTTTEGGRAVQFVVSIGNATMRKISGTTCEKIAAELEKLYTPQDGWKAVAVKTQKNQGCDMLTDVIVTLTKT